MKKTKLTRSLLAACSIVALTAVMYGCVHDGGDDPAEPMVEPMPEPMPTPQEQIAELQTQINALRAELGMGPINIDELTDDVASLTRERDDLQKQVDDAADAEAAAAAAAKKAMAAKLYAGLAPELAAATTVTNALNGTTPATISIVGMNVSGDADGTDAGAAVTIEPSGAMLGSLHGWAGNDYVRKVPGMTDHVVLYNNQDAAKMEPFATKYATQLADSADGAVGRLGDTTLGAANASLIASTTFASGSGFIDHTKATGDVVRIRGSFSGGMGYYQCEQEATAACRSAVDGSGGITLSLGDTAGGWTFEPDAGTTAETPDAGYLIFGWWSREVPTGVDVATFAQVHGTGPVAGAANAALIGTATYVGGAAGKYSINEPVDGDPNSGAFTARAELTAKFGNATALGTISGMLSGFMAGGEAKDWTVALKGAGTAAETAIAADGFGTAATTSTVWTIGGVAGSASGGWSGDFYYETTAQQTAANTPPVAAGTFSANYGNVGRMVGAFGAEKQ
ncbi:MAG: hypothetical protein OXK73_07765 [Rhodospirillaceae bacterium]|nr:hypothetical protein [Rhodospirillaceae bacterium]